MLERLVPPAGSLGYQGSRMALWLAGLILFLKILIALGSIFNGYEAASGSDGIPLASYTPESVQTILTLFGVLGASQLAIGGLGLLILFRYRGLLPLLLLVLALEFLARRGVLLFLPIQRTPTTTAQALPWAVFALIVGALALSLRGPRKPD